MKLKTLAVLIVLLSYFSSSGQSPKKADHVHKDKTESSEHQEHKHNESDGKDTEEKHDHGEQEHAHNEEGEERGDEHVHEEHEEEECGGRVGPTKAIVEASKKTGIKLSEKAIKALDITTEPINSQNTHKLPLKSLVHFQEEVGVYRQREGWFKLIEVEVLSKNSTEVTVKTQNIKPGDDVAVTGVALLRVAELEAWGGSGDGHGH